MRYPPPPPRLRAVLLGALLASAAPVALQAQPALPGVQGRTGPEAAAPQTPAYARPTPGFISPPVARRSAPPPPESDHAITEVRVAGDHLAAQARPPRTWRPTNEPGADLRLQHQPGQPLDAVWVRSQFALNGLPAAGGVGRALALVQRINRAYLSAGFVNSGLVVRPSGSADVLELQIIYGGLAPPADGAPAVSVDWTSGQARGLNAAYVRARMPAATARPLSAIDLERDFRLLAEDPAIRTVNADLRPGSRPGEASLALSVYPQDRFDLYLTGANNRSPSVGGERVAVAGALRNLLVAGDIVSGEVGVTDGVEDAAAGYAAPFLSPRNTISLRGAINRAAVIDRLLAPLDITARDRSFEFGLTRKLVDAPLLPTARDGRWSPARTLSAGLLVAWRTSTASLLGEPFSFAPGAVDGRTEYTALRLVGDYVVRNVDRVFAISLTGTLGLDGTRADTPGVAIPRQNFRAVLAQVNYARRLSAEGLELRARLSGQWADSVLYSGERFSAGGETTVRGYRENLLLADKGAVGSLELAQPLQLGDRRGAGRAFNWGAVTPSVFADGAVLRNHRPPHPERAIYSLGAALAWTPSEALSARIAYGVALNKVDAAGQKDIQDQGVHVRLTVHPLQLWR